MIHHFISGLPRSGSSLFAALLQQNPRIHAGITSPVARLYAALLMGMSDEHEGGLHLSTPQRRRLLQGLFGAYYAEQHDKALVFDTSRAWSSRLPGLADLFPAARMVCCVRDVNWVVDSFERVAQGQPHQLSALFSYDPEDSVSVRAELLTAPRGTIGYALDSLKQAFYGEHAERLLLVRYDSLASDPARVMAGVYAFLDEPLFDHDFANVQADAEQFDRHLQTPGLHRVRRGVSLVARRSILPPALFDSLQALSFWHGDNPRGVKIL